MQSEPCPGTFDPPETSLLDSVVTRTQLRLGQSECRPAGGAGEEVHSCVSTVRNSWPAVTLPSEQEGLEFESWPSCVTVVRWSLHV